jgi:hypothetical protein
MSAIGLIDNRMKIIKRAIRLLRIFLFVCMFAVCMVMGIVPVIPKRKERFEIEVKLEDAEEEIKRREGNAEK